jgi:hypothetical protein
LVQITGLNDININSWAGTSGALQGFDDYCTVSCQTISGVCSSGDRSDYKAAVYTVGVTDAAGNFYISNGNDDMQVELKWTHPISGTFILSNYNVTLMTSPRVSGAINCSDPSSQTTLAMTVPASELATAVAGTYTETFQIDLCRFHSNDPQNAQYNNLAECLLPVNVTVNIPELIHMTGLSDIDFGIYSGGDVEANHNFCIFRNAAGGFSLTTTGSHDGGGRFNLAGAGTIAYRLEYSQGSGYFPVTPGVMLSNSTSSFIANSARGCDGGTNTSLRLTIDEADIISNPSGIYSDTLIIIVEPE